MRELTLLETGYLAGLLLLSLVLPINLSMSGSRSSDTRRSRMKIVWIGQIVAAVAGVLVLVSTAFALYAFVIATVSYVYCFFAMRRRPQESPV